MRDCLEQRRCLLTATLVGIPSRTSPRALPDGCFTKGWSLGELVINKGPRSSRRVVRPSPAPCYSALSPPCGRCSGPELRADARAPDVVDAARALYLAGAEQAVRSARRERRWAEVARIRREQAIALYHTFAAGVPPPAEVMALYREGMLAELRSLAGLSRDAEVGSAGRCPACREDDGRAFRITVELRAPRLPHPGCPKGICGCDGLPTFSRPAPVRRKRRSAGPAASRGATPRADGTQLDA